MNKPRQREVRFASILTVYTPDANSLIDMMRYDRCHPLDEANVEKIARLIGYRSGGEARRTDRVVQLLRTSSNNARPEVDRWRSFGCSVLDERAPDADQLTEPEIAELAAAPGVMRSAMRKQMRRPTFVSVVSVSAESAESVVRAMGLEHCCPLQEIDSSKIESLAGGRPKSADRLIRLVRFTASDRPPDDAACRGFGCDVLDERSMLTAGPSDAELGNLAALPFDLRGREVRR